MDAMRKLGPKWLLLYLSGGTALGLWYYLFTDSPRHDVGGAFGCVGLALLCFWGQARGRAANTPEALRARNERRRGDVAMRAVPPEAHCPTCSADHTQLQRISVGSKVATGAAFGVLAAGSLAKTFRCQHCGYSW